VDTPNVVKSMQIISASWRPGADVEGADRGRRRRKKKKKRRRRMRYRWIGVHVSLNHSPKVAEVNPRRRHSTLRYVYRNITGMRTKTAAMQGPTEGLCSPMEKTVDIEASSPCVFAITERAPEILLHQKLLESELPL
jgi:hypothetical protein